MGMFDWVKIEYPLENPKHNTLTGWQTKAFGNELHEILIDKDGQVWLEKECSLDYEESRLLHTQLDVSEEKVGIYTTHPKNGAWIEYVFDIKDGRVISCERRRR